MQVVAETPIFTRQTEKLFSEEEKRELIDFLAENPMATRYPAREVSGRSGSPRLVEASAVELG